MSLNCFIIALPHPNALLSDTVTLNLLLSIFPDKQSLNSLSTIYYYTKSASSFLSYPPIFDREKHFLLYSILTYINYSSIMAKHSTKKLDEEGKQQV